MTVTLQLKPEVEEQLEAQARASGLSVKDYLEKRVEEMIRAPEPRATKTPQERVRLWEEFIANHSVGGPPLSDYAVSRESIYTREDEML